MSKIAAVIARLRARTSEPGPIRHGATKALCLQPRGGIPNDVLTINDLSVELHLEWFAREVHPSDRDLPDTRQAELFAQQCLEDVDAALPRLFERLPEIDVIDVSVLKADSKAKIISGIVHRESLAALPNRALGMKLKAIGVNYRLSNLRLEPISISDPWPAD